ncbi:hypothetical protein RI367_002224 [Sorochytrium milnesiophthora]
MVQRNSVASSSRPSGSSSSSSGNGGTGGPRKKAKVQFDLEEVDNDYADVDQSGFGEDDDDDYDDQEELEKARGRRHQLRDEQTLSDSDSDRDDDDDGEGEQDGNAQGNNSGDVDMLGNGDDDDEEDQLTNFGLLADEGFEGEQNDSETKIEPFHMRSEMEEGAFDESGTYIRRKDEHQAAKAAQAREQRQREQEREKYEHQLTSVVPGDRLGILEAIAGIIQPRESVAEALARLNVTVRGSKNKPSWQKSKKAAAAAAPAKDPEVVAQARKDIDLLTECSDKMMGLGHLDVYETTYEEIMSTLRRSNRIGQDWQPVHPLSKAVEKGKGKRLAGADVDADEDDMFGDGAPSSSSATAAGTVEWRYKWQGGGDGVFGPFKTSDMQSWAQQGFFDGGILLQKVVNGTPTAQGFEPSKGQEFLSS